MGNENKKTINNVPMREAETKEEKLLLGFLNQEAERIGWGQIVVELTVRNGVIVIIKSNEISRTFNVGA
jgi:hypothetical protein